MIHNPVLRYSPYARGSNISRIRVLCTAFKILNVNEDGADTGISAIFHWRF